METITMQLPSEFLRQVEQRIAERGPKNGQLQDLVEGLLFFWLPKT
jgi:hypothetical protein